MQSICSGSFKVHQGAVFQQPIGLQEFYLLLLQPFRFSRNRHLLESVPSLCVPRILYLGYCHVGLKKKKNRELWVSSAHQFTLESTLILPKGKKAKTALAWGWMSQFSLGFTAFSIQVASHFVLELPGPGIYFPLKKLFSQKLFFSCSPAPVLLLQRSGCCYCLSPSPSLPGLQAKPAFQLLLSRSVPTV